MANKTFSDVMASRTTVDAIYRKLLHEQVADLKGALENFDVEVSKISVTIDIEEWLDSYDNVSTACEAYMLKHYSQELLTFDDWESLMDFECLRHPEWAFVE